LIRSYCLGVISIYLSLCNIDVISVNTP